MNEYTEAPKLTTRNTKAKCMTATLEDSLIEYTTCTTSAMFYNQSYKDGNLYLNINVINHRNPVVKSYRRPMELIGRRFGYYFYGSNHVKMKVTAIQTSAGFVNFQFRAPVSGYSPDWCSRIEVNKDEFLKDMREIESMCTWCS